MDEILETIWNSALDATSEDFRENGVLNEQAYKGYKSATMKRAKAALLQVITREKIAELELYETYDKAQNGIYSGEVYRRNRIAQLEALLDKENQGGLVEDKA